MNGLNIITQYRYKTIKQDIENIYNQFQDQAEQVQREKVLNGILEKYPQYDEMTGKINGHFVNFTGKAFLFGDISADIHGGGLAIHETAPYMEIGSHDCIIGNIGAVRVAPVLHNAIQDNKELKREIFRSLTRYIHGDWGELNGDDCELNENAIISEDDRILAKYETRHGTGPIYIITEWDRSYTTLLYCSEY